MDQPTHLVAIFGGAVSGSEAANQLSQRGIASVVFDQNVLPYGKIEDGLPKWHSRLRDKEIGRIGEKLSHPLVTFVPQVKLGEDVHFEELANMGFSAVLLATGAWRDRPLAIDGVDAFLGKGLVYQNPFIYWYNHKHEPGFEGISDYEIEDGVAIVGGGLASLDVAKVLMFELVEKALRERGHEFNMFKLDRSIAKVLDSLDLTLDDLGIKGCTLYYRRRVKDMPLSPLPSTTPEQKLKAEATREKILNNYQSKYLFNMAPNHMPIDKIVEGDRLTGLVMQETEIVDGRVKGIEGSEKEVHCPYVVSSIGSLPEMIAGIPAQGQTYQIEDEVFCRIKDHDHVFALGNAVTGRGNIKESMVHGREITQNIIEGYLADAEEAAVNEKKAEIEARISQAISTIADEVRSNPISAENYSSAQQLIGSFHQKTSYHGDFLKWAEEKRPTRLEDLVEGH